MRTYEVLFILSSQTAEEATQTLIGDFKQVAETGGAKLVSEEAWGRRRLAYPINKANEGVYHLFTFEAEAESLSELDRKMKNSDVVMRHLISRTDEGLKRAAKLAAKNPKKERRPRPAAEMGAAPGAERPAPPIVAETTGPAAETTEPAAETTEPAAEMPAAEMPAEPAAETPRTPSPEGAE
jgi:small subunit ribosomal protein S6